MRECTSRPGLQSLRAFAQCSVYVCIYVSGCCSAQRREICVPTRYSQDTDFRGDFAADISFNCVAPAGNVKYSPAKQFLTMPVVVLRGLCVRIKYT